jgi:hypothetical protein
VVSSLFLAAGALNSPDFITLLGGAAASWPLAARAQQPERMRRIGLLMSLAADDKQAQARLAAFLQGLQELGWTDGRNVRIDIRWRDGEADRNRRHAAELLALAPDVILASGGRDLAPGDQHRADRVHADLDPEPTFGRMENPVSLLRTEPRR